MPRGCLLQTAGVCVSPGPGRGSGHGPGSDSGLIPGSGPGPSPSPGSGLIPGPGPGPGPSPGCGSGLVLLPVLVLVLVSFLVLVAVLFLVLIQVLFLVLVLMGPGPEAKTPPFGAGGLLGLTHSPTGLTRSWAAPAGAPRTATASPMSFSVSFLRISVSWTSWSFPMPHNLLVISVVISLLIAFPRLCLADEPRARCRLDRFLPYSKRELIRGLIPKKKRRGEEGRGCFVSLASRG